MVGLPTTSPVGTAGATNAYVALATIESPMPALYATAFSVRFDATDTALP
jgi:hypothetical protein